MKNIYRTLMILAAALLVIGCTDIIEGFQRDYSIRLELSADDVTITRATQPGDNALNENLIKTVDYFLYPAGDTTSNATLIGRIAPNASSTANIEADIIPTTFNTLFPADGDKCEVYVIANLPEGSVIPSNTKLSDLRAIAIGASFKDKPVQESFVMTCLGQVQRSGTKSAGSIKLKRVASKFSLQVSVVDKFVEDRPGEEPDIVWTPMPANMTVVMKNFADTSNVGGAASAAKGLGDHKKRSFKKMTGTGSTYTEGVSPDIKTFTKYNVDTLWYSYPRAWTDASKGTSFLITLPWKRPLDPSDPSLGDKYQKCYYKILLNEDEIGSNKWYNIVAELKVLGSFYEDSPTLVLPDDLDYTVLDWRDGIGGTLFNTDATIKDAGYLTVSSNSYLLDNVNSIAIPFSSSEECEVSCVCKYQRYNGSTWEDTTLPTTQYTINCSDGFVNLTHVLKNEMPEGKFTADDFDLSEFNFTIELYHKGDKANYCETITVTQRPALVIDYITNTIDAGQDKKYTVIVNGNRDQYGNGGGTGHTTPNWYNVSNRTFNGNMYRVKVSRTDDYIIGDPRTSNAYTDNDLGMEGTQTLHTTNPTSLTAPAFYVGGTYYDNPVGHTRNLEYYYPTNWDPEYSNMISPEFRFASECSNCNGYYATQEQVRWRCATYQELGYPAGRWRVPTSAEIKYVGRLCASGVIPSIFNDNAYYWAADGVYQFHMSDGSLTLTTAQKANADSSQPGGLSRCVYDEWYWGQSDYAKLSPALTGSIGTNGTLVWGDMPRENFK